MNKENKKKSFALPDSAVGSQSGIIIHAEPTVSYGLHIKAQYWIVFDVCDPVCWSECN